MTDGPMTGADNGEVFGPPPKTGNSEVDQALADLAGLESVPLPDHHDRLAQAQARLQAALEAGTDIRQDAPDRG
jgi:hypothetical protein